MRRTPRSMACLVGLTGCLVGLVLAFSSPVASKAAADKGTGEKETGEKSGKVKELQQKRLAVLQTIHDMAKKGFNDGLVTHEQLRTAKTDLLSAKLDYAETKKDRIKACDEAVKDAKEWQKIVQEGTKAQVFSRFDELKAESDLLEAQITRENTETDED